MTEPGEFWTEDEKIETTSFAKLQTDPKTWVDGSFIECSISENQYCY